jgi:hypothetical protein
MKNKTILLGMITVMLLISATTVFAAKPANNLAGAQKVAWHLSGAVMPVPPYGSLDIPGSDTASKLIVNQPNGNTQMTLTGVMGGLNPETEYTVYISNGYTPYVFTGWDVVGTWVLRLHYGASIYDHDIVINVQPDGTFTGTGGYPAGGSPYSFPYNEVVTGTIDVMTGAVTIHSVYQNGYFYDATGTIAADGTMSGTWKGSGQPTYTWESISGHATKDYTGSAGWSGYFNSIPTFTFTTNANGEASWHVNLKKVNLAGLTTGNTYSMSVWINMAGGTILISDPFSVTV